jgi:hypothetical protein
LWIQSSLTLLDYQPYKHRRVGIVSDDRLRNSHRSRRGNLANLIETLLSSKRPGKETPKSTNLFSMLGTDREYESKELTGLAWGNLR